MDEGPASTYLGARIADATHEIGVLELIENDPRPTFVLDVESIDRSNSDSLLPAYWNQAFIAAKSMGLLPTFLRSPSANGSIQSRGKGDTANFRRWIFENDQNEHCVYSNFIWTRIRIKSRWIVINGVHVRSVNAMKIEHQEPTNGETEAQDLTSTSSSSKRQANFDWTDENPPLKMTPHLNWARSIDWSGTSLGATSTWTPQLRSFANLTMQDPRPAVVFYGRDLIMIYNEAYIELLGGFHPCMGESARVALVSVWEEFFEPMIQKNLEGESVERVNYAIPVFRNGFLEETYFSFKFIPIFDSDGATIGHYEPLTETVCQAAGKTAIFSTLYASHFTLSRSIQRRAPVSWPILSALTSTELYPLCDQY